MHLSLSLCYSKQAGRVLGAGGEEDGDGDSDSSDEMTQTLLEVDYETIIDDEDVVDEFCIFRSMLEGTVINCHLGHVKWVLEACLAIYLWTDC